MIVSSSDVGGCVGTGAGWWCWYNQVGGGVGVWLAAAAATDSSGARVVMVTVVTAVVVVRLCCRVSFSQMVVLIFVLVDGVGIGG